MADRKKNEVTAFNIEGFKKIHPELSQPITGLKPIEEKKVTTACPAVRFANTLSRAPAPSF